MEIKCILRSFRVSDDSSAYLISNAHNRRASKVVRAFGFTVIILKLSATITDHLVTHCRGGDERRRWDDVTCCKVGTKYYKLVLFAPNIFPVIAPLSPPSLPLWATEFPGLDELLVWAELREEVGAEVEFRCSAAKEGCVFKFWRWSTEGTAEAVVVTSSWVLASMDGSECVWSLSRWPLCWFSCDCSLFSYLMIDAD